MIFISNTFYSNITKYLRYSYNSPILFPRGSYIGDNKGPLRVSSPASIGDSIPKTVYDTLS